MSRALQHQLHGRIQTAAAVLDLPLTPDHIERLAVELTPAISALVAERDATIAELEPIGYTVSSAVDSGERVVREFAGCTLSIRPEVAEDAPAALLGLELHRTQPDVLALDVAAADQLVVTVQPQSAESWSWWRRKFDVVDCTPEQPCCSTSVGRYGDVRVELRGEGVPDLLAARSADRLSNLMAGHPW